MMETITIVNPVRTFRLENFIRHTLTWIARDECNIDWILNELKWLEENPNVAPASWIEERRRWAEGLLAEYQEDLRKDKEHLEGLRKVLNQIEKPL